MMANNSNIIYPELSYKIMGAIFEVHKELGPGFVESVYEKALVSELNDKGLKVEAQKVINLLYKNKKIGTHRLDLVVDDKVILEIKALERFANYHRAQLTSYLKASGYKLGILTNFAKEKVEYKRVINK